MILDVLSRLAQQVDRDILNVFPLFLDIFFIRKQARAETVDSLPPASFPISEIQFSSHDTIVSTIHKQLTICYDSLQLSNNQ